MNKERERKKTGYCMQSNNLKMINTKHSYLLMSIFNLVGKFDPFQPRTYEKSAIT